MSSTSQSPVREFLPHFDPKWQRAAGNDNVRREVSYALVPEEIEMRTEYETTKFAFKYSIPEPGSSVLKIENANLRQGRFTGKVVGVEVSARGTEPLEQRLLNVADSIRLLAKDDKHSFLRSIRHHFLKLQTLSLQ